MSYYFGIDGGGTKSRIRIADVHNQAVYEGIGESTNIYAGSREQALHNLKQLIEYALGKAHLTVHDIGGGCVSSAGLDRQIEKMLFSAYITEEIGLHAPVYYCNDGESLLVGGLQSLEGMCLIAGTGALAVGRLEDGTLARSGGLGYMIGDEGSAYWIMHQAIRRSLRSLEYRDLNTRMMQALLEHFHLSEPGDFIPLMHSSFQKADIAAGASLVTDFALKDDPLAVDILKQAVDELVDLVESVIIQLPQLAEGNLVISGGVLERDAYIQPRFLETLSRRVKSLQVTGKKGDAVYGACLLAATVKEHSCEL